MFQYCAPRFPNCFITTMPRKIAEENFGTKRCVFLLKNSEWRVNFYFCDSGNCSVWYLWVSLSCNKEIFRRSTYVFFFFFFFLSLSFTANVSFHLYIIVKCIKLPWKNYKLVVSINLVVKNVFLGSEFQFIHIHQKYSYTRYISTFLEIHYHCNDSRLSYE